jgi:hypothetical protein
MDSKTTRAARELGMDRPTTTPERPEGVTIRGPNRKARRAMQARIKKHRKQYKAEHHAKN